MHACPEQCGRLRHSDGVSIMNTNARSPTGMPPANILPSAFSLITCSRMGDNGSFE
jgi:hypothetical protein